MCEYGFSEGIDFCSFLSESTGGRPSTDHSISVEMAKELCMIQRNEIGRNFRQYFIKVEEAWNSPEATMARALQLAQHTIDNLSAKIEEQKPMVAFANTVAASSSSISMDKMAKLAHDEHIQIGRNRLFKWLRDEGYLMADNTPYQRYIDQGLFELTEYTFDTPYGSKIGTQTYVTGKGQIYIIEKLKEKFL